MRSKTGRSPIVTLGGWLIPLIIIAAAILAYGRQLGWYVISYLMHNAH